MPADFTERVIQCIAKTQHLDASKITLDSTFEELGIDSLDGINILFALENEFEVNVPDDAAKQVRTIRDLAEGLQKLMAASAS
ncbi:MAG: acyl carrier protein [Bryobacterales bacterium]|nr:acyl carrier protein [Bryobacterales bacterium]